ncbi:MFS transporter [Thermocatellispora tengchongensis]|uniref:MFS transporter n=1 Tax=Thermocatellispora tengchongensis TaxID=1073253 RepID=UPI003643BE3C
MTPYRGVLGLPGVRSLTLVGLIARIPVTATGLTLTLHVTDSMKLGFTQAGLVGTAATLGTAVGAPLAGRFVDRHGLRPVLLVTTAAQLVFWLAAPALPYYALLVAGAVAGLLSLPVFTVIRQCLAAMVPAERRRPPSRSTPWPSSCPTWSAPPWPRPAWPRSAARGC